MSSRLCGPFSDPLASGMPAAAPRQLNPGSRAALRGPGSRREARCAPAAGPAEARPWRKRVGVPEPSIK